MKTYRKIIVLILSMMMVLTFMPAAAFAETTAEAAELTENDVWISADGKLNWNEVDGGYSYSFAIDGSTLTFYTLSEYENGVFNVNEKIDEKIKKGELDKPDDNKYYVMFFVDDSNDNTIARRSWEYEYASEAEYIQTAELPYTLDGSRLQAEYADTSVYNVQIMDGDSVLYTDNIFGSAIDIDLDEYLYEMIQDGKIDVLDEYHISIKVYKDGLVAAKCEFDYEYNGTVPTLEPELETETLWSGAESFGSPQILNVNTEDIEVTDVSSSDTNVLDVECYGDSSNILDYILMPGDPGTAVITVTFMSGDVEYTVSGEYTVKAFPVFISNLYIDDEAIDPDIYNYHNYYDIEAYEGTSPNVQFTVAEGWNFDNAYYNRSSEYGDFEEDFLGEDYPEEGLTFDFPDDYNKLNTFYVFRSDEGDEIQFGIRFSRPEGGVDPGDETVLDTIEITNINTELIPGQKPEFTAELLSDNMTIVNERWFKTDQTKILAVWSEDLPEVGDEFKYFITVGAREGYTFAADPVVIYNDEVVDAEITVDNETDLSITGIIPNVTVTEPEQEEAYVESIEFNAFPRLRKEVDGGLSATAFDGDAVTLNYSDGTSEKYILKDHEIISETTGTVTEESSRIIISYGSENHVDYAAYYNGEIRLRDDDPSASYVAKALHIEQSAPVVLVKGKNSGTVTDESGNEYEEYSIPKSMRFNADDRFIVTYENGLGETIDVDYVYTDSTGGFTLAEDSDYYTGYPSDNYFGNYFDIGLPDQSENHFEVGKTYTMNIIYHEYDTDITSPDDSYAVMIREAGPEDVTRIYFEDTSNVRIANGETVQLAVKWEPEYINVPASAIEWTSTHPEVASVDENGLVTANLQNGQTNGDTQIVAKIGNYSARKNIIVYTLTEFTDQNVNLIGNTAFYTGEPRTLGVRCGYKILVEGQDYEAVYSNNTYIGDASVTITGKGDYKGTVTKTFKIVGRAEDEITQFTVEHEPIGEYTYSGEAFTPAITSVSAVGKGTSEVVPLVEGEDYEVLYENNTNAGTGRIVVCGLNYYMGAKTITFTINKAPQKITGPAATYKKTNGNAAFTLGAKTSGDGKLSYSSSKTTVATVSSTGKVTIKGVGTATITITAAETDNYSAATKNVTIKVVPKATTSLTASNLTTGVKLTWKKVAGATGYKVYKGSTLIKKITSGSTLTYTYTKANTNGTKYTFKVVPYASSGDGASKSVIIYRLSKPAITSATNSAAGKATVKWGKNTKATGYEIWYSTSKAFSTKKTKTITKNTTVSTTFSSLTKGKTYYVKIRTYKTVSGKKYYSAWSAVKTVKITK